MVGTCHQLKSANLDCFFFFKDSVNEDLPVREQWWVVFYKRKGSCKVVTGLVEQGHSPTLTEQYEKSRSVEQNIIIGIIAKIIRVSQKPEVYKTNLMRKADEWAWISNQQGRARISEAQSQMRAKTYSVTYVRMFW